MHTRHSLTDDLVRLGVGAGDTLFVHSSFKSLGPVDGGAATVIASLEDALAPGGLLLMPSFNLVEKDKRAGTWNIATTPSTVGYLTEFFRLMPGTVRSDHYSHSVAARGCGAGDVVAGHLSSEGPESPWDRAPWGRTFGARSPFLQAYDRGGKLLMLGVDYHSSTFVHLVETLWWNERREKDPAQEYVFLHRDKLGGYWDSLGRLARGRVGDADCRLFAIRDFVETLLDLVRREPENWMKWGG
ncbi:MAG: AAC(3) family N-acetyltransferase [Verrucomicrobiota bacterium]